MERVWKRVGQKNENLKNSFIQYHIDYREDVTTFRKNC